jgi:hypothetical protein
MSKGRTINTIGMWVQLTTDGIEKKQQTGIDDGMCEKSSSHLQAHWREHPKESTGLPTTEPLRFLVSLQSIVSIAEKTLLRSESTPYRLEPRASDTQLDVIKQIPSLVLVVETCFRFHTHSPVLIRD